MLKFVFETSTFIALFIFSEPAALLFPTPAGVDVCPLVAIGFALAVIEDSPGFNVAPIVALIPSTTAEPVALELFAFSDLILLTSARIVPVSPPKELVY